MSIDRRCHICPIASCLGAGRAYAYIWLGRAAHPERFGQRCCVIHGGKTTMAVEGECQVIFEEGQEVSGAVPRSSARRDETGPRKPFDRRNGLA